MSRTASIVFLIVLAFVSGCKDRTVPPRKTEGQATTNRERDGDRRKVVEEEEEPIVKKPAKTLPTKAEIREQIISMKGDEVVALIGRPTELTPNGAVGCDVWRYRRRIASDQPDGPPESFDVWVYVEKASGRVIKIDL